MMEQRRVQQKHFCVSFYDLQLFRMSFIVVLTLLTSVCSLQVVCCPDCQEVNQTGKFNFKNMCTPLMLAPCCTNAVWTGVAEGRCPLNLISTALKEKEKGYSEKITLQFWMKNKALMVVYLLRGFSNCCLPDVGQSLQIEIYGEHKEVLLPVRKCKRKSECKIIRCCKHPKKHYLLEYDFKAEARKNVSVSYISKSTNCSVYYLVPDPRPDYTLSVNKSSKTISVKVDSGDLVYVRWCYEKKSGHCSGGQPQTTHRSAVLSIPHLLPCVCVEMYYTYTDASRHKKCPFRNESLFDIRDILQTSEVQVFGSHLLWRSECHSCTQNISAALCWKMSNHACIPVPNSTLEKENKEPLKFKTSTIDKHPQLCVQFFIQDSHNISCLFQTDKPSWETYITPDRQSMSVHITSTLPAKFSAQLCVLTESGCVPRGQIHSETLATNQRMNVPILDITERPCVQVWQSDPTLIGRRILCPDYTHNRWGIYAVGVFIIVVTVTLLGAFIQRATKSGMAGWLTIKRPLLLVCSSDQSTHISAVCTLGSILQEKLGASVHTALWAQTSQTHAGNGASVADLGPLPWLYGQWEAIRKAQGKILIVWSPEAKRTCQRWIVERVNMDNSWRPDKIRASMHDYLKLNGWRLGKNKKEKCRENESFEDENSQKEPSTVIEPVFVAALASLEGALQEGKGKDVAIVYFQGLCHNRDIPQAYRGVPRYCVPQEFSGLIQELAEVRGGTKSGKFRWHCWPRLLSKVLSVWLARQLTKRLQTVLPQTQAQCVSSSTKTPSDQTHSRRTLSLASMPSNRQEQEFLNVSPWGAGEL